MQKTVMITVNVANAGDEFIKQQHLQAIANAADDETLAVMGQYANKPGTLDKLKGFLKNPLIAGFAKKL